MESITIPEGVISIGDYTFTYCSNLASIDMPNNIESIGEFAFYGCSELRNITIPNGVKTIKQGAFLECSGITAVTIPEGVTSIGDSAFYNCSALAHIYCRPTTPPQPKAYYGCWETFHNNAEGRKIYVPTNSLESYKSTKYWNDYAADIVGYDF